jgi:hypothetical protein
VIKQEVIENYLISFTIKRAYYLTIVKLNIIDLRLFFIN